MGPGLSCLLRVRVKVSEARPTCWRVVESGAIVVGAVWCGCGMVRWRWRKG